MSEIAGDNRRVALLAYDWSTRLMGGSIRAFSFARALPEYGWRVLVFTASSPEEWPEPMPGVEVCYVPSPERGFGGGISADANDSRLGTNPGWLRRLSAVKRLLPLERQLSWYPSFWRTVPKRCADVHAVLTIVAPNVMMPLGHVLSRKLGVPHIIDLRDDFADRHRVEPITRSYQHLLNSYGGFFIRRAAAVSVVSPVTVDRFRAEGVDATLIMNGYVEDHFSSVPWETPPAKSDGPLRLVHLGWLGDFRSVAPLLRAVAGLSPAAQAEVSVEQYGLIDPGQEDILHASACATRVRPQIPHSEAVSVMRDADVLLVIPGDRHPAAMTGKLFEYLRARRHILLIAGDGAARTLANAAGIESIAAPGDTAGLVEILQGLLARKRGGGLRATSDPEIVRSFDRRQGARQLADLLNKAVLQ
jgi:Glycosyl transferase 4-like domain